jgi:hypothetical protein
VAADTLCPNCGDAMRTQDDTGNWSCPMCDDPEGDAYEPGQCGECPACGSLSPWRCGCIEETERNDTDD